MEPLRLNGEIARPTAAATIAATTVPVMMANPCGSMSDACTIA